MSILNEENILSRFETEEGMHEKAGEKGTRV